MPVIQAEIAGFLLVTESLILRLLESSLALIDAASWPHRPEQERALLQELYASGRVAAALQSHVHMAPAHAESIKRLLLQVLAEHAWLTKLVAVRRVSRNGARFIKAAVMQRVSRILVCIGHLMP